MATLSAISTSRPRSATSFEAFAWTRQMGLSDIVLLLNCWLLWSISYYWQTKMLTIACIAVLLLRPAWRHSPLYWTGVVFAWLPQMILNWQQNEDHVYLVLYWIAATGLSLWGRSRSSTLAFNARLLVGLCFLVAAVWKTSSPEFRSGEVLGFKMLQDFRFRELVTGPVAGLSGSEAASFDLQYRNLRSSASCCDAVSIPVPERLVALSAFMTWWTVLIEWTVAILFLWPRRFPMDWVRHAALLGFIVTTYFVVPVMGFANAFCIMGLAQCGPREKRWGAAYGVTMLLANLWYYWRGAILASL